MTHDNPWPAAEDVISDADLRELLSRTGGDSLGQFVKKLNNRLGNEQVIDKGLQNLSEEQLRHYKNINDDALRILVGPPSEERALLTNTYLIDALTAAQELGSKYDEPTMIYSGIRPLARHSMPVAIGILTAAVLRERGIAVRAFAGVVGTGIGYAVQVLNETEIRASNSKKLVGASREKEIRNNVHFAQREITRRRELEAGEGMSRE